MKTTATRLTLACISLIFFGLILIAQSYAIDPQTAVGIWFFDEGEGEIANDSSENGNDGELVGSPDWVEGKFGTGLKLDGEDDYVKVPDSESLNPTQEISISVWVYPDGVQPKTKDGVSAQSGGIVEKNQATGYLLKSWDTIGAEVITYHFSVAGQWSVAVTPGILNEWQHIACTYNNEEAKIYLNGELKASNIKEGPINGVSDNILTIGMRLSGRHTAWFKGIIDDVAIFNVALTEGEIKRLMNKGVGVALGILTLPKKNSLPSGGD